MRGRIFVAGMLWLATACASAMAQEPRATMGLEQGWRFKQAADISGAESRQFDASSWAQVTVPHTWNRLGNTGIDRSPLSNNVQGVGWYRRKFRTPPAAAKDTKHYFLQFDAVGAVADVWLNGRYLGKHAGAFSRFRFDATAAMQAGGENVLVVKADNSKPAPGSTTGAVIPLSGDFFVCGGIYRKVSLIVTGPVHVDMLDYGGPGVYAKAVTIAPAEAVVEVATKVVNDGAKPGDVKIETDIKDATGKVVASATSMLRLAAGKGTSPAAGARDTQARDAGPANIATLHIPTPHLWRGTLAPYLYHVTVTVSSVKEGALLDRVTQPLGLRTLAFDPDKGFFLNGEHLFLRGASMHQDREVKSWAVSDEDQKQDFDFLTDMGGNAVRLAHYQHDQRSYELADERGIIAWAEIPLVNQVSFAGTPADAAFTANARQQLLELIRQNYNHPSIAVWSIANEVDLRPTQNNTPSRPRALLELLNKLAKSEDPTRFTTMADCCELAQPIPSRDAITGITDTLGYNRYFGWYTGRRADFGPMLDAAHARHPNLPIAVSEYGAGAALTQHTDDPNGAAFDPHGRPHPEEVQELYHEQAWNTLKTRPYLWGVFIWNMFDFASDSRKEGDLTDINDKGMVSYDRSVIKDTYYFYRANWSNRPTLHLVGRRYTQRARAVFDVKAYSNASQARLSLNGKDQGATPCSGGICLWRAIHLQPGKNKLTASTATASDSVQWTLEN